MKSSAMRLATDGSKALPKRIRFTVSALAGLKVTAGKDRIWVYDDLTAGLCVSVMATGNKSFYYYKKIGGRAKRIRIGGFPEISIEQARKQASKLSGEVAAGGDPHADRLRVRHSDTLDELWTRYQVEHSAVRLRESTIKGDVSRFNTCLADWGSRKLSSITGADCRAKHAALGKVMGPAAANRGMQLLRGMFNFARIFPGPVAREVSFFRENSRERFLQPLEVERLFKAVDGYGVESNRVYGKTIRDFVYLSLWTGARSGNVKSMRWADVDLEQSLWRIPFDQSKSKKPMTIHLCKEAIEILTRRKAVSKNDWVLPSRRGTGHLHDAGNAWEAILETAGIEDFRLHDLRRTLGSWMVSAGASLPAIGKQLGHVNVSTTAIYSRMNLDATKPFVDAAVSALVKAGMPKSQ